MAEFMGIVSAAFAAFAAGHYAGSIDVGFAVWFALLALGCWITDDA